MSRHRKFSEHHKENQFCHCWPNGVHCSTHSNSVLTLLGSFVGGGKQHSKKTLFLDADVFGVVNYQNLIYVSY